MTPLPIRNSRSIGRRPSGRTPKSPPPLFPSSLPTAPIAGLSTDRSTNRREYFRAAAALVVPVAEALDHAHEVGVVHRDMKPSNLMLDAHGKVWITDFGLARINSQTDMTMSGDLIGTLLAAEGRQQHAAVEGTYDAREWRLSHVLATHTLAPAGQAVEGASQQTARPIRHRRLAPTVLSCSPAASTRFEHQLLKKNRKARVTRFLRFSSASIGDGARTGWNDQWCIPHHIEGRIEVMPLESPAAEAGAAGPAE